MFGAFQIIFFVIFGLSVFIILTTFIVTTYRKVKGNKKINTSIITNNTSVEQMEKMATVLGKVAVNMAKEINPEYKALKCPNCGAPLTDDVEVCEYCDTPLTKIISK